MNEIQTRAQVSLLRLQGRGSMIITRKGSLLLESQVVESTFPEVAQAMYLKWRSSHVTSFIKHLLLHRVMFSQSPAPSSAMKDCDDLLFPPRYLLHLFP